MRFGAYILPALATLLLSVPAQAQDEASTDAQISQTWDVCNETSFVLRTAVATDINGKLTPRGWTRLRPGGCASIEQPGETTRYVYAESSPAHQGGIREWKGSVPLCVGTEDFIADSAMGCLPQGLDTRLFIAVDPTESVTHLMQPEDFKARAETAGLQRLLRDNGYDVSRVDGRPGRRTTRSLTQFLNDKNLPTNLSTSENIDHLEEKALEYAKTIGLTVCNNSSSTIWTAIGRRRKDNWESRGWWPLDPTQCIQPVRESLLKTDMHVFARQEVEGDPDVNPPETKPDRHLRTIATSPSQFCISEAKFSALGRENCADQGYQAANFRTLPPDQKGVTVTFTDADFAEPSSSGLRR